MSPPRRRRKRWLLWILAGFAALVVAAYLHYADPARLRAQALAALGALPLDGAELGEVRFEFPAGFEISALALRARASASGTAEAAGPVLQIGGAHVRCRLGALLRGRVEPRRVEIDNATLIVTCATPGERLETAPGSLDAGAARLWQWLRERTDCLPAVRVDQADVQLVAAESRGETIERRIVGISGRPTSDGYRLRVDRYPVPADPVAELAWGARSGDVHVRLDWLALHTLRYALPARAVRMLDKLELNGRVRLNRLALRGRTDGLATLAGLELAALDLSLADLTGVVPLETEEGQALAALGGPYVCFTGGNLSLCSSGNEPNELATLTLRGDARVNAADARFTFVADGELWRALLRSQSDLHAGGSLDRVRAADLVIAGLELPTTETHPAFLRSTTLPHALRCAFVDYRPAGRVNLRMQVLPRDSAGSGTARVRAEIEALDACCRCRHFPYDVRDLRGRVEFADGQVRIHDLCGRHASAALCANGTVYGAYEWTAFDLVVRADRLPLDDDLYAALPASYQRLWQTAAPLGVCDAVTTIHRDEGSRASGPLRPDVNVDAHLLTGSLALGDGRRLRDVDGRFTIHRGVVQIDGLHGHDSDAELRMTGDLILGGDRPAVDLCIQGSRIAIAAETAPTATPAAETLRFQGHADVWGRVYDEGGETGRQQQLLVHVTDGDVRTLDPARAWNQASGWAVVRDGRRELLALTCRQGKATLSLAGLLPMGGDASAPLALSLHAQTPALEQLPAQFVPGTWREASDRLGLSGAGTVAVCLNPENDAGGGARQLVDVQWQAAHMRPAPLPLDLRDARAHLVLTPAQFELIAARARGPGQAVIAAHGAGRWKADLLDAELSLRVQDLALSPELGAALPEPARKMFDRLALRGSIDARIERIQVAGRAPHTWTLTGTVPFRKLAFQLGLDAVLDAGSLSGDCVVGPDGEIGVDASFEIAAGRLAGRSLSDCRGQLVRVPGDRWVQLNDVTARLCDGEVRGAVLVDADAGDYELSLTMRDVAAHQFLPPPRQASQSQRPGRIDGTLYLRGRGDDASGRRGGGELRLRGVSFLHLPVLESVFLAGPLGQRGPSETVDRADLQFLWEGAQLRLQRVEIYSRDLRFVGTGTWNMSDDSVEMTLVGASPDNWPRIEVVTDLLELAGQELVQYRVDGPLAKPRVTTQPLRRLNETLQMLLRGAQ